MLVADASLIIDVQTAIVGAAQSLTDEQGNRVILSTIDDRRLRTAALAALHIATGEVVWPGDQKIKLGRPKPAPGVLNIEE